MLGKSGLQGPRGGLGGVNRPLRVVVPQGFPRPRTSCCVGSPHQARASSNRHGSGPAGLQSLWWCQWPASGTGCKHQGGSVVGQGVSVHVNSLLSAWAHQPMPQYHRRRGPGASIPCRMCRELRGVVLVLQPGSLVGLSEGRSFQPSWQSGAGGGRAAGGGGTAWAVRGQGWGPRRQGRGVTTGRAADGTRVGAPSGHRSGCGARSSSEAGSRWGPPFPFVPGRGLRALLCWRGRRAFSPEVQPKPVPRSSQPSPTIQPPRAR